MLVTVLYRECGGSGLYSKNPAIGTVGSDGNFANYEDQIYNAFEFHHPGEGRRVTVGDLVRAFPLGSTYHFDVMRRDGVFESVQSVDLGSPVPISSDGVITCRVFRLACPPRYASGGRGKMLDSGNVLNSTANFHDVHHRRKSSGSSIGAGASHSVHMMKDITKNAGKATKGLLGFVGHAVQRTAEYLTQQELTIGVYKVQIVKELAEGGRLIPGCGELVGRTRYRFLFPIASPTGHPLSEPTSRTTRDRLKTNLGKWCSTPSAC